MRWIAALIGSVGYSYSFAVEEKEETIRWQEENVNSAEGGLYAINADTLSALIDKTRSREGQGLLNELKRINLFDKELVKIARRLEQT